MKSHIATFLLCSLIPISANPGLKASAERGHVLYKQVCFNCHGHDLEGGIGPSLADAFWKHGDTTEAINRVITKGIEGTEMMAFEAVHSVEDRQALTDFLLSKQVGIRSLVRECHEKEMFKGKPLTTATFKSREASEAKAIPENSFWVSNKFGGAVRFTGKLYVEKDGPYNFNLKSRGKSVILIDGKELPVFGDDTKENQKLDVTLDLKAGVYDFEMLHVSKRKHGHRMSGSYGPAKGPRIPCHGRSLQGNTPMFILPEATAKVARKWIKDVSPRALLCILPNKVITAYDPASGSVENAWHSARVNQTPSLPDRSAAPSTIEGKTIGGSKKQVLEAKDIQFKAYEYKGDSILIHSEVDGKPHVLTIKPEGEKSYSIK